MSSVENYSFTTNNPQSLSQHQVNVSPTERWVMGLGGGSLAVYGLSQRSPLGLLLTAVGAGLVHTAVTGHCDLYHAFGIDTANDQQRAEPVARDVHLETSIHIEKDPAEVYRFWRQFENLPRFMQHLQSVEVLDNQRSHWVAKGPAGETEEWDAEIYNEKENELIAWRSLENADVVNAGTVRFEPAPSGTGTLLKITINYNVPGGKIADSLARFFGQSPEQMINEDLERLKQLLESGVARTSDRQGSTPESSHVDLGDSISSMGEAGETKRASKAHGGTLMGRTHTDIM